MSKNLGGSRKHLAIALIFSPFLALTQKQISLSEVSKHVGETVSLCGKVYGANLLEKVKGKPTLLNLGGSNPNERIEVRIKFEDRGNFSYDPEALFLHKSLCLVGKITKEHGYAEILMDKFNSTKLLGEAYTIPKDSSIQNTAIAKADTSLKPKTRLIKTFSNAYLLTMPKLNGTVITWLKQGSSVVIDYTTRGWCYVKVIENSSNPESQSWLYGFVRNQALGLTKRRRSS